MQAANLARGLYETRYLSQRCKPMNPFHPNFSNGPPIRMQPAQPVGDPEPYPPHPGTPAPPSGPDAPVHAPRPSEPELPAIDPHQPGLPDPRIRGALYVRVEQRWLM